MSRFDPDPAAETWTGCTFWGPPPDGYTDWRAFLEAPVKRDIFIRALTDDEKKEAPGGS